MSPRRRERRAAKGGTPERGKRDSAMRRASVKKPPNPTTKKSRQIEVTTPTSTKEALRKKLRGRRAQLSCDEQRIAGERARANLAATRLFLVSRRIACYLPSDGELDTSDIIERMWRMGKNVFLPVLSRITRDRLWFAPARPGMELVPNRYGIPEPRVQARDLVRAQELDLILLPVVAFDNNGNRLGRGAGYYDRSLAFLRFRRFLRKPRCFGLAHNFQRTPKLDLDPWDIPLDGVVTDRTVYYVKR